MSQAFASTSSGHGSPSKLSAALELAAKGFRVFPLRAGAKLPAIPGWPELATTEPAAITEWWSGRNSDRNIGVLTGDGVVVLDVDNKNGVLGSDTLTQRDMLGDETPETFTVRTPTGGFHHYFRAAEDVRNSAAKLGPGLDLRGHHGFVVGPGSTIGGGCYSTTCDRPLAALPRWMSAKHKSEKGMPSAGVPAVALDQPHQTQRAISYLQSAEPAIEGAGGDHHTFQTACKVKDLGVSKTTALELMLDHWNERCAPPWQPDELAQKVENAYRYGVSPAGIADPALDFGAIQGAEARTGRLFLELAEDVSPDVDAEPLVDGYLDAQAFSVLYGESNTGKTFVALDIAFHVAAGRPWNGLNVRQGPVVYFAAEGGRGIRKRIAALKKHHGTTKFPLAIVPCPLNLVGPRSDAAAVSELLREAGTKFGAPVALVVVDTLARAMAGADENAFGDMTAFVRCLDNIRAESGGHVMVVHHSGKDTSKGARGHSSLRAATDTELEVTRGTLTVRKQRDIDHARPLRFSLDVVELGQDRRGRALTSCVVRWDGASADFRPVTYKGNNALLIEVLTELCAEAPGAATNCDSVFSVRPALEAEIRKKFISCSKSKNATAKKQAYRDAKKTLVADGVAKIDGDFIVLAARP